MLKNTFVHIQGIGSKTEGKIWRKGILTWENFLEYPGSVISAKVDNFVRMQLKDSLKYINNIAFFNDRLSSSDTWRLFNEFKGRAVYLDIETSGGYMGMDEITVIGLYDGEKVQTFVNGLNLNEFEIAVSNYDLVITFNGAGFDLPFIRRSFPNISLPSGHIDLRSLLNRLGYKGGLKIIEKEFGLLRGTGIGGMDGLEAIRLWREYQWGDQNALDLLIEYNTADTVNLKPLMEKAFKMMKDNLLSQIRSY